MRKTVLLLALALSFGCILTGCGSSGSHPALGSAVSSITQTQETPDPVKSLRDAQWQAILNDPGIPGEDYDPDQIILNYYPGARLPKGVSAGRTPLCGRAASRPNPVLRKNTEYEVLTDAIASEYGLIINQQVYIADQNLATFFIPEGVDGDAVIEAIRRDFAGVVEHVTYSRLYHQCYIPNDPDFKASDASSGPQWSHHKIDCPTAWEFTKGHPSVTIAVLDTGVRSTHEELVNTVLGPENFPGSRLNVVNFMSPGTDVTDNDGHGTFIAGLIASQGDNNNTLAGVAYDCRVIPIKISNGGSANDGSIIAGAYLAGELGAKVINLSWGDENPSPFLEQMINTVTGEGVFFVAAAGNENTAAPHYPSEYENAFSVASTNAADQRTGFSNYSVGVDLAAPGNNLKSCSHTADTGGGAYDYGQGTSYSAPIVAAGAALLWVVDSELTHEEVRDLLIMNGKATTGFTQGTVRRMDLGQALLDVGTIQVFAPLPDKLVYSGAENITVEVFGDPTEVEAYLDGQLMGTLFHAPWEFTIDTTAIEFGQAVLQVKGIRGPEEVTSSTTWIIDNSEGRFPIMEDFENGHYDFTSLDAKYFSEGLLSELKSIEGPGPNWTKDLLLTDGKALWTATSYYGRNSGNSMYCGTGLADYGDYETDVLVSRLIDLTGQSQPTAVYYQRYNLQDGGSDRDRATVYAYDPAADTYTTVATRSGGSAEYSGSQADFAKAELDLSAFEGSKVHLVFLMESDADIDGEDDGLPKGWWVDDITVATGYLEDMPEAAGLNIEAKSVFGAVNRQTQINVELLEPVDVVRTEFVLDLAPVGTIDGNDVVIEDLSEPFTASITVPLVPNTAANLMARIYDSTDTAGPAQVVPVYVFNLRGDVNLDNMVDQADLDAFPAMLGITSGSGMYSAFFDTNLDGTINELDADGVGYNWGKSIE